MAISVVQSKSFNATWSGSFGSNVAAGNTVFLYAFQYSNAGTAMGSSNPLFGGSAVGAASKVLEGQAAGSATVYGTIWMLPNLAGGAASVALTNSGGTIDSNVGLTAIEVSGLGATPAIDTANAPNPVVATGSGASTPSSGASGAMSQNPELILGLLIEYGTVVTAPGAPWVAPTGGQAGAGGTVADWQIATSSGSTYTFGTSTSGQKWVAAVAGIYAGSAPFLIPSTKLTAAINRAANY
jgi:hypothetical protein